MRYIAALVHSWWWHLTYGMWKGFRETRIRESVDADGETCGRLVALCSTDRDYCVKKVFWERTNAALGEQPISTKE